MKRRGWVLIVLGAVLAILVGSYVNAGKSRYPGDLDPGNPKPNGARAIARVLEDEGVEVIVARGAVELAEASIGADTMVLVTSSSELGESTTRQLLHHSGGAVLLLVVDPDERVARQLGYTGPATRLETEDLVQARCLGLEGLSVRVDQVTVYRSTIRSCLRTESGALLADGRGQAMLLGAPGILQNRQILQADNAAVALRLLGQAERLVWYVPKATDQVAGDEVGLAEFLPTWLTPALWVVGLSVGALVLWRGRRLGPLATEPLPVTVKAIETAQSRGRLYRKAQDRAHAARALRQAAVVRLGERLRLPHDADPTEVAGAAAAASGRSYDDVRGLLYGGPPTTDRDLIHLATGLADLDDSVRKAPR